MTNDMSEPQRKMMNGELPVRAEVTSKDGASSSMKVSNARIVRDGIETTLLDDEITLSTNTTDGDKTDGASASMSIPVNDQSKPEILTKGNASVTNMGNAYDIEMLDNKRTLKINSDTGLFAVIRVSYQRDEEFKYLDVLFGSKGQPETIDEKGKKDRPHIAFYSDGNGKFIRLSGYDCELKSNLGYDQDNKDIYPSCIEIYSYEHSQKIVMDFEFNSGKRKVILKDAYFKRKTRGSNLDMGHKGRRT